MILCSKEKIETIRMHQVGSFTPCLDLHHLSLCLCLIGSFLSYYELNGTGWALHLTSSRQALIIFDSAAVNKQNVPRAFSSQRENRHKVTASTAIHCIIDQGAGLPSNSTGELWDKGVSLGNSPSCLATLMVDFTCSPSRLCFTQRRGGYF